MQKESLEPAVPADVCSGSLLHPRPPAAGGVLTREAEWGLEACTLADTDLAAAGGPADASAGPQAERTQTRPLGSGPAPGRNDAQSSCPLIRTVAW